LFFFIFPLNWLLLFFPDENHQSNLAHFLTLSSSGCFLYTDMILNLFHEGKLQLKSSSLGMVPLSLSEIYLLEFNLRFPTQDSFSRVKDILSICVASLRPLSLEDVWNCVNSLKVSSESSGKIWWHEDPSSLFDHCKHFKGPIYITKLYPKSENSENALLVFHLSSLVTIVLRVTPWLDSNQYKNLTYKKYISNT